MGTGQPVGWQSNSHSQARALSCPVFEMLMSGDRGGGKSDVLLMDFLQFVGRGFGAAWRGVIWRREYKDLDDIIARSRKWIPELFPGRARFLESTAQLRWVFEDGADLRFRAIKRPQDYWGYHGQEIPWHGWEELTEWASLDTYLAMMSTCRSSVPGVPRRYRSNCNPFGVGHNAVKRRFIDACEPGRVVRDEIEDSEGKKHVIERTRMVLLRRDNKHLARADPQYEARLMADTNTARREAWVKHNWDIVAGGMFDDVWDRKVHVLQPFEIPKSWKIDRAFDWGSSKPFSVGWWAESDGTDAVMANGKIRSFPPRTLFRIGEWYGWNGNDNEGCGLVDSAIAKGIKDRERAMGISGRVRPGPADSSIFDEKNNDSTAKVFEKNGVKFVRADKSPGSRQRRWSLMRDRLEASKAHPMEEAGLFVVDTCRDGFLRTVPVAPRDTNKPEDIDTDSEDHVADEAGYRCLHTIAEAKTIKVVGY